MAESMTAQEKRWRTESDARTLAEAKTIQNTPARFRAATKAAVALAKEAQEQADALKNVKMEPVVKKKITPASVTKKKNFRRVKKK